MRSLTSARILKPSLDSPPGFLLCCQQRPPVQNTILCSLTSFWTGLLLSTACTIVYIYFHRPEIQPEVERGHPPHLGASECRCLCFLYCEREGR